VIFYLGIATPGQKYLPPLDMTKFRFTGESQKKENKWRAAVRPRVAAGDQASRPFDVSSVKIP